LKVSDEFTVPLSAIHHRQLHDTGKERDWWQERNIDPLKIAGALWHRSTKLSVPDLLPSESLATEPVQPEPVAWLASGHSEDARK
jgi:hypothetical protein